MVEIYIPDMSRSTDHHRSADKASQKKNIHHSDEIPRSLLRSSSTSARSLSTSYSTWAIVYFNAMTTTDTQFRLRYSTNPFGSSSSFYTSCLSANSYESTMYIPAPSSDTSSVLVYVQSVSCTYSSFGVPESFSGVSSFSVTGDGNYLVLLHPDSTGPSLQQSVHGFPDDAASATWMMLNAQPEPATSTLSNYFILSPSTASKVSWPACQIAYGDTDNPQQTCAYNSSASSALDLSGWSLSTCTDATGATCSRTSSVFDSTATALLGRHVWIVSTSTGITVLQTPVATVSITVTPHTGLSGQDALNAIFIVGLVFLVTIFAPLILWWSCRCHKLLPCFRSSSNLDEAHDYYQPGYNNSTTPHAMVELVVETEYARTQSIPDGVDPRTIRDARNIRGRTGKIYSTTAAYTTEEGAEIGVDGNSTNVNLGADSNYRRINDGRPEDAADAESIQVVMLSDYICHDLNDVEMGSSVEGGDGNGDSISNRSIQTTEEMKDDLPLSRNGQAHISDVPMNFSGGMELSTAKGSVEEVKDSAEAGGIDGMAPNSRDIGHEKGLHEKGPHEKGGHENSTKSSRRVKSSAKIPIIEVESVPIPLSSSYRTPRSNNNTTTNFNA